MVRATFFTRSRANCGRKQLQTIVAYGLRQEYPPVWPVPLPPPLQHNAGKPTLVLDIDETLVHTFGMQLTAEDTVAFRMYLRPHLCEFLQEVKELYEIVFWTAGTASYCSAIVDAMEVQVLQLPPSFYNVKEIKRTVAGSKSTDNVNFFALSRPQTLEQNSYMKYLPMLGRPLHRVIMIDDNVRSFPLHPRNGVKITPFLPDDRVLMEYSRAVSVMKEENNNINMNNKEEENGKGGALFESIERGRAELARLEQDTALLNLLPLLRTVAKADDLPRELDYWRDDNYIACDDFHETMNSLSVTRQRVLGSVLSERRETPIPPPSSHVMNHCFVEEANTAMKIQQMRSARSRL